MPNTPAQLGEGMTVWTASADVSEEQKVQGADDPSVHGLGDVRDQ